MVQVVYSDIPKYLQISAEDRRAAWEANPPKPSNPFDGGDEKQKALREQQKKARYERQLAKKTQAGQPKPVAADEIDRNQHWVPFDGLRWNSNRSYWEVDPMLLSQEDKMATKLIVTPYDANGLVLARGKTSVAENATQEMINAKVNYAFHRAGKKATRVELTKDGAIHSAYPLVDFGPKPVEEQTAHEGPEQEADMAKKKATKKKATGERKPGVIACIVELISRPQGATIDQMIAVLTKKFPDRKAKSMTSTCKIQANKNATTKDKNKDGAVVYYKKR